MARARRARRSALLVALGVAGAGPYLSVLAPLYAPLADATVWSTALLARTFGLPVARSGTILLHASGFACDIDAACAGTVPAAAVAIAVLLTPASRRRRSVGIVALTLLAITLNLVRLTTLLAIGVHAPTTFPFVHAWVWPVLLMAMLAAAWRAWRPAAWLPRPPFLSHRRDADSDTTALARSAAKVSGAGSPAATRAGIMAGVVALLNPLLVVAPVAASAARPPVSAPGDLIVRFANTSPAHAAVMQQVDNPKHGDATAAVAAKLSSTLQVPLRAVQVTSGRELVLSIERVGLATQVAERVAQAPAFRSARATAVIAPPADHPPTVLPPSTLLLKVSAPPDSDAGRAVANARRGAASSRERIAALAGSLVPGHDAAVAARVDAQGRLLIEIDMRVLVAEVVAALRKHPDVVYAQANQMLRPGGVTPR